MFLHYEYLGPPKGERSDTPAAHVASVRGEGVTAYMTADGNAEIRVLSVLSRADNRRKKKNIKLLG